jgi:hypothetical protein
MAGRELQRSPPVQGTLTLAREVGAEYRWGEGIERAQRIAARISGAGEI